MIYSDNVDIIAFCNSLTVKEKLDKLAIITNILLDEYNFHNEKCKKLNSSSAEFHIRESRSLVCEKEISKAWQYRNIIVRELEDGDPEREVIETFVRESLKARGEDCNIDTALDSISYFDFSPNPEDGCNVKSVKESVFTEKNIRAFDNFASQIPFYELINIIRYYKINGSLQKYNTRLDSWKYLVTGYLDCYNSTNSFVKCFFVESFINCAPKGYEWISSKEIYDAAEKYLPPRSYNLYNIKEACEMLWEVGYLEKHHEDIECTEDTRYRIRY